MLRIYSEELEIAQGNALPVRYLAFPPWKTPYVEYCRFPVGSKIDCSEFVIRQNFLNNLENHRSSAFVFADGPKCGDVIGFGVVFLDLKYIEALPS